MPDVSQTLLTLIGVISGSILTLWVGHVDFRRRRDAEIKSKKLEKLEELYSVLSEIRQWYVENHTEYSHLGLSAAFAKAIEARKEEKKERKRGVIPFSRMMMLTSMYAPSLQGSIEKIMSARSQIGELVLAEMQVREGTDAERRAVWEQASRGLENMNAVLDEACEEISRLSAQILK